MTKERMFYIAYKICNYFKCCEMQNQLENYEFCMEVSDLANEIDYAIKNNNNDGLKQYYDMLYDELENLYGVEYNDDLICYIEEVKDLISLLNECNEK